MKPAFLITIDTEGDNIWSRPREVTTRNARFLPRFQALCDRYELKPTYLTNWEMACDPVFVEMAGRHAHAGTAEVGMHLHAWNSPPIEPLTDDDRRHLTYLIDYPEDSMRRKIDSMTAELQRRFEIDITSHRAGRWAFDARYARMLEESGYLVDCSVTPAVSWKNAGGAPGGGGGTDYSGFPDAPYFLDLRDIRSAGSSRLLELPMTVRSMRRSGALHRLETLLDRRAATRKVRSRLLPAVSWLRPNGRNRAAMLRLLDESLSERRPYAMFMLHSSELMPGGSPFFREPSQIDGLYADMEALFQRAAERFEGMTLSGFHGAYTRAGRLAAGRP